MNLKKKYELHEYAQHILKNKKEGNWCEFCRYSVGCYVRKSVTDANIDMFLKKCNDCIYSHKEWEIRRFPNLCNNFKPLYNVKKDEGD